MSPDAVNVLKISLIEMMILNLLFPRIPIFHLCVINEKRMSVKTQLEENMFGVVFRAGSSLPSKLHVSVMHIY